MAFIWKCIRFGLKKTAPQWGCRSLFYKLSKIPVLSSAGLCRG
jgi:hypothetical protein